RQGWDAQVESERQKPQASSRDGVPGQGQKEFADNREMSMLPSSALLALAGLSLWKVAENPCLRTEVRRLADERQLGAEFLVFCEMPGRKIELTCGLERQGHTGAHQLTRKPKPG